ncbi:MAG: Na+/H+ antiporter subunit E [Treponema sp.]|nr:Na+/H+ antiporter subunit E [Treponema sp.]
MFFLYLIVWLIFAAQLDPGVLTVGILISAAVYWFALSHLRHRPERDLKLVKNIFRGLAYACTLIYETVKANMMVFRIVYSKHIEIDPCLIYFNPKLRGNFARTVLANSITLTPGTITVALNGDQFCVHCLNKEMARGLDSSIFIRLLRRYEG